MNRQPGRYNLDRIGWKAFEDLIVMINQEILGATVTPFRMGADEGRDGFFKGQMAGEYSAVAPSAKTLVIQCKHTSTPGDGLKWSDVSLEKQKVAALAKGGEADIYAIFTNRRLAAEDEKNIRAEFESVSGVKACLIRGEEWIEPQIDGNFRLLRRVPRLFGVGDLSQILSHGVSQQTRLILDVMKTEQAVFVPTASYSRAVRAMETRKMVVLVGPPASGKSAIATNLCMVLGAEHEELEVLKIETADQFSSTWSAADPNKLFWVDDFFGETRLDQDRAKQWSSVFAKLATAVKGGSRFIFTCRDYILKDAHGLVKKDRLDALEDARVFVQVDELVASERGRILYNHVKHGDLELHEKSKLKPFLPMVAGHPGFTPEIARRLGTRRFYQKLECSERGLREFVQKPVQFFVDIIDELGPDEQATIAYLLLSGNSLPEPVTDVPVQIRNAYGVDVPRIRRSLEVLRGSLTKFSVVGSRSIWQVHHPSMIDAMHAFLKNNVTMLDLFVVAAPVKVVLRDCLTVDSPHTLFVPDRLYDKLAARIFEAEAPLAARFLADQAGSFLSYLISTHPDRLAHVLAHGAEQRSSHWGIRVLCRMIVEMGGPHELSRRLIEEKLGDALWKVGSIESLYSEEFDSPLDEEALQACLREYPTRIGSMVDDLKDEAKFNSRSPSDVDDVLSHIKNFKNALWETADRLLPRAESQELFRITRAAIDDLEEELSQHISQWDDYINDQIDEMKERGREDSREDSGIFSDVDK